MIIEAMCHLERWFLIENQFTDYYKNPEFEYN